MELRDSQNWKLVLSQYGVPEGIPFFVNFSLNQGHSGLKHDSV
jgi:hypothetical protein